MIVKVIFKNNTYSFELTHEDDIQILKQLINQQFNIKPYNQRLFFLGKEINTLLLKDYYVIHLVERLKLFQLYIKYYFISNETNEKTLHTLMINNNSFQDNILSLKIKIEEKLPDKHKLHAKYQRLIKNRQYLNNSYLLSDYKINIEDTIHLFSSCYANY